MSKIPIFTIGYGSRQIDAFIGILKECQIQFLVDIRTSPHSKFNPDFSQTNLRRHLADSQIRYVFMGDLLGGQPRDKSCYTDGKVDYDKCKTRPLYLKGIDRLRTAWIKQLRIAIMCSEGKPQDCHRSKLIGETLSSLNIDVRHIDETGLLKTQEQVIGTLFGNQLSFFERSFTSRKRYRMERHEGGDDREFT